MFKKGIFLNAEQARKLVILLIFASIAFFLANLPVQGILCVAWANLTLMIWNMSKKS